MQDATKFRRNSTKCFDGFGFGFAETVEDAAWSDCGLFSFGMRNYTRVKLPRREESCLLSCRSSVLSSGKKTKAGMRCRTPTGTVGAYP